MKNHYVKINETTILYVRKENEPITIKQQKNQKQKKISIFVTFFSASQRTFGDKTCKLR